MASVDDFTVTIKGKGGHAALPEKTIDPIVIGSAVVSQPQTLVSRTISSKESAVVTNSSFQAGMTTNVNRCLNYWRDKPLTLADTNFRRQ